MTPHSTWTKCLCIVHFPCEFHVIRLFTSIKKRLEPSAVRGPDLEYLFVRCSRDQCLKRRDTSGLKKTWLRWRGVRRRRGDLCRRRDVRVGARADPATPATPAARPRLRSLRALAATGTYIFIFSHLLIGRVAAFMCGSGARWAVHLGGRRPVSFRSGTGPPNSSKPPLV